MGQDPARALREHAQQLVLGRRQRHRAPAHAVALRALSAAVDSSTCVLISTRLLRELSRNPVSKNTLVGLHRPHTGCGFIRYPLQKGRYGCPKNETASDSAEPNERD